jgi:hypothetical protein
VRVLIAVDEVHPEDARDRLRFFFGFVFDIFRVLARAREREREREVERERGREREKREARSRGVEEGGEAGKRELTPTSDTAKVAAVSISSSRISWLRWLSSSMLM